MRFGLLLGCYVLLSVALVGSDALSPEVYWKNVLPHTPMPKAIKESLAGGEVYYPHNIYRRLHPPPVAPPHHRHDVAPPPPRHDDAPSSEYDQTNNLKDKPYLPTFFLQTNIYEGSEMTLHLTNIKEYPKLIKPDSMEVKDMKQMLKDCENKDNESEEVTYCATSLESMVDFAKTNLGKNVKAISTEVINGKESASMLHKYKMEVVEKLSGNNAVVCHKQDYAYSVFSCHKSVGTDTYAVSMVGADGVKVNAVAVCYTDTAKWNPTHLAFQALKVKPGVPICHFLPEDHVVWVPY